MSRHQLKEQVDNATKSFDELPDWIKDVARFEGENYNNNHESKSKIDINSKEKEVANKRNSDV